MDTIFLWSYQGVSMSQDDGHVLFDDDVMVVCSRLIKHAE